MDSDGNVEIADFSFSIEPKRCRVGDDIFEFAPVLPLGMMEKVTRMGNLGEVMRERGLAPILELMQSLMFPKSYERFVERVNDVVLPIDHTVFMRMMQWLLEVYGLRPTEPSSPSSESPESTGMTSTAGA